MTMVEEDVLLLLLDALAHHHALLLLPFYYWGWVMILEVQREGDWLEAFLDYYYYVYQWQEEE